MQKEKYEHVIFFASRLLSMRILRNSHSDVNFIVFGKYFYLPQYQSKTYAVYFCCHAILPRFYLDFVTLPHDGRLFFMYLTP